MHFEFQRVLKLAIASWSIASSFLVLQAADPKGTSSPVMSDPATVEPFWLFIPFEKPLDLSELLQSLGEIPSLNHHSAETSSPLVESVAENPQEVALVGNDEPIVIGQGEGKEKSEPAAGTPSSLPSNPLRKSSEEAATPSEVKGASELPLEPSEPPLELILDDDLNVARLPDVKQEELQKGELELKTDSPKVKPPAAVDDGDRPLEIGDTSTKSTSATPIRPRPKMVEVKPITPEEQESPRLLDEQLKIDAKQTRDEDEKAMVAKRPEAASKSFVGKPSMARLSNQGKLSSSNPADVRRTLRVESCLAYYLANPESVVERSPWAVMHAMLPFGVEGEIIVGNRRVNSIQWMCYNGTCRTQKLFTPAGKYFRPNVGGGVQGHEGQFLAMLAQSQVSSEYPIVVGQKKYTITDLIRYEMATCREKSELTFKLMGLSYYVDSNQVWLTDKRSRWNIERLVQEELAQPIVGAACGGTHRLMALTFAVRQRQAEGRPIDGQFARADRFVREFVNYAWKLQNPDGSFSTNWFESRGNDPSLERKIQTTGHILEWLAFTLPEDELTSPRFTKSIDFLLNQIWDQRTNKWPIGPRGHATRAIALYHQRTTGISPGQRQTQMAKQIQSLRTVR